MRFTIAICVALSIVLPARAEPPGAMRPDRINRRLAGCVVDYTHNDGRDRRIFSPILGMPRDLYVYLPPGYDPGRAYPMVVFLHMATVDEQAFLDARTLIDVDAMIARGECPPMVVASPDGTFGERDGRRRTHSFFLNGPGGRFEDHVMQEVIPFMDAHYAIRPGRASHAMLGTSAGGLGAMSLAIRHRDRIGAVATLGAPLNLRYANVDGDNFADFDPARYRWKADYDPEEVVARYVHGLLPVRARKMIAPVFGEDGATMARIAAINPSDLLFTTDLRPGELAMYVNYPARGEWNFDAQDESFAWLAAHRGIGLTMSVDPDGRHNARYFRDNVPPAFRWLGEHLMPPSP